MDFTRVHTTQFPFGAADSPGLQSGRPVAVSLGLSIGICPKTDFVFAREESTCTVQFLAANHGMRWIGRIRFLQCIAHRTITSRRLPYPVVTPILEPRFHTLFLIEKSDWLHRELFWNATISPPKADDRFAVHHFCIVGENSYTEVLAAAFSVDAFELREIATGLAQIPAVREGG